jgi:cytochrome P450
VVIRAEGRAFHTRDIRGSFPQMLEIVDRILADMEGRPRY